jgi:DNA-binding CsgD family transcriptional regulator
MDRELRVLFQADGACWGAAGLVRGGQDFTDREADLLVAVAPAIAAATRVCVRAEIRAVAPPESPAIVVVGPSGALHWLTPAALSWRERIDEISRGRFLTMMNIMAAGMRGSPSGEFRGKMRDASGRWAVLHAAPLVGADGPSAAVVITAASGRDVAGLLLAAYGLTLREREICAEVLAGGTTAQISDRLCISAHTVQDHLKSIFAKVSVHSRGQLAARLQPGMDAAAR